MPPRKRKQAHYLDWEPQDIKALRAHMGLTQEQMAGELGIRQQTVSEWETGMYRPRGASVRLLTLVAERAGFAYAPHTTSSEPGSSER